MSGGIPRLDIGAGDSRSKVSATTTPPPTDEQKAANIADEQRRRAVPGDIARAKALQPPDIADMALKDAASGKVRRIRAGSMGDSLLSSWGGFLVLLGVVGLAWVRAVLRGDVW